MGAQTKHLQVQTRTTSPAPTVTPTGTTGGTAYNYKLVAKNAAGGPQALAQSAAAGTAGTTATGNAALSVTNYNHVTWTDAVGAASYDVYRTVGGATQGKIGTVLAGVQAFDDTGLVADGATAPTTNGTGVGIPTSVAHFLAASYQCSGGGAAFVGTLQFKGSIDGVEWEAVGSAFTAAGFGDLSRRYALLRADMTAYTSGAILAYVHGVSGGGD